MKNVKTHHYFIGGAVLVGFVVAGFLAMPVIFATKYKVVDVIADANNSPVEEVIEEEIVVHIPTPEPTKAIYMSGWVAGTTNIRKGLVDLIEQTELNSVVIDVKDYTGRISFSVDKEIDLYDAADNKIGDIKEFIKELHAKGIYVIARIAVFQDPYLAGKRPDLANKSLSKGTVWKDYKGMTWVDTGSKEVWNYAVGLGKVSYEIGFDEINYDYIRFPADGNLKDLSYPFSKDRVKREVVKEFFEYLRSEFSGTNIPISADVFGMTTTNTDDLGIGQILEDALVNFDYVAPMVYPSHYTDGFIGFENPASKPYEVVQYSMAKAVERAVAIGEDPKKLRAWLQDFDLGADYGPLEVKAQMKAIYDVGLDSWMLWSPGNKYTKDGLLKAI